MSVDRRHFLRAAAGAAAAIALPACGNEDEPGPIERAVARSSIGIDYASYHAPAQDVRRLVLARAADRGARVTFSDDQSGLAAQRTSLERWIGPRGGFRAVVIAPFDSAAIDPVAATAIEQGIAVVSYLVPLRHQTAAIAVDPTGAGAQLADAAAAWARDRAASALLIRPPAHLASPDPFVALAPTVERSLRRRLAQAAPDLRPVAATVAQDVEDAEAATTRALADYPDATVALTWNDGTAVGAAKALRKAGAGSGRDAFAGGVALPGVAGGANLDALATAPVHVTFVAPRLQALAERLVDVPLALLRERAPGPTVVTAETLDASSPELAAFRADYRV